VWGGLYTEKSNKSIALWSVGGVVFGLGLVLMANRPSVQPWVSHELASTLICMGALSRIRALHTVSGFQKSLPPLLALAVVHAVGYIVLRQLWPDISAYFVWAVFFIGIEYAWTAWLAYKIGHDQKLANLRWMTLAYVPMAIVLFFKGTTTLIALAGAQSLQADSVSNNVGNLLIAFLGIFGAVLSNTSFLAMFVERASHEREANVILTAQRKATQLLAQKVAELDRQRSLHTMAAALSHELGQPMTSIKLLAEASQESPTCLNTQKVFALIHDSINIAIGILKRMRNLGKADSVKMQKVDLILIHQQVTSLMREWLQAEHASVQLTANEASAKVQGDPIQLSQILINLYRNAVQASQDQDQHKVSVDINVTAVNVTLAVRDNGPGFSAAALAQAGQHALYTTKAEGMGIGLSIVRDILEQHQGQLNLSNHPEGGAWVRMTLPR
jgi:signal transduction histidine kinase